MMAEARGAIRRVLLTRLKFIGDVVLTTPAVQAVREALPEAEIVYLAEREASSLLEHHPAINAIVGFDFSRPTLGETLRVVRTLRSYRFDLAIDFFSNPRSALLCYLSGAPMRVGLDRSARKRLYTVRVRDDGRSKSAPEFHQQLLTAVGIRPTGQSPLLVVTAEERLQARRVIQQLQTPEGGAWAPGASLIVMHVGGTWPAKLWGAERFAALADRAVQELGATVLLSGGPRDAATVDAVLARVQQPVAPLGVLPLRMLAAVLAEATAVVSNDAGPMHIAAAIGTPTIGLFGPGQEEIWFPYERSLGHQALRHDVPCHPCHLNVCNRTGDGYMECMQGLTVEEVFDALRGTVAVRPR